MATEDKFQKALKGKNLPILVLDQKWHQLFKFSGKPEKIQELEKQVNELLRREGQLHDEIREYKNLKGKLLHSIVHNMDGTEQEQENSIMAKKLETDRAFVEELNEKIAISEDALLDLPKELKETNEELMLASMLYCYGVVRENAQEISEITEWMRAIRPELRKRVVKKQACEASNTDILNYMQDIFGTGMMNLFGLK